MVSIISILIIIVLSIFDIKSNYLQISTSSIILFWIPAFSLSIVSFLLIRYSYGGIIKYQSNINLLLVVLALLCWAYIISDYSNDGYFSLFPIFSKFYNVTSQLSCAHLFHYITIPLAFGKVPSPTICVIINKVSFYYLFSAFSLYLAGNSIWKVINSKLT
jgi:hypothetical protein